MPSLGNFLLMGSVPLLLGSIWAIALFSPVPYRPLTHGPRNTNAVALTFDDGPSYATQEVLEILDQRGVRATFFMVGENVRRRPEVAALIASRGHEVEAHSDRHSRWLPYQLPFQSGRDAARGSASVVSATDAIPRFYRPPHGKSSPWMRWSIARKGLKTIGWLVDGGDWKRRSSGQIVQEIVERARPGSIILLHDGLDLQEDPDRTVMVAALPLIIDGLRARGFSLVTLEELLSSRYLGTATRNATSSTWRMWSTASSPQ